MLIVGRELADLWIKAVGNLKKEDQQQFGFSQDDKRVALELLIQTIEKQKNDTVKAQLKIQRKQGKPIVLRDVLAKIVTCVSKFKEVGDVITQYDPGHAALPWAAVRLVLQAAVGEQQIYDSMLEGLEHVADVTARYAWVETLYLHASSKMRLQLQDSIVKLYAAVLDFLAKARRHYSRHTYQRVLKSLVQFDEQAVQKYLRTIAEREEKVNNIARLVDAQYLREISKTMDGGFSSLLNRVDGISQQITALQVNSTKQKPASDVEIEDMLKWLDPVSTYEDYHTAKVARQTGTCDWILQREEFQGWLNSEDSSDVTRILWFHGKPGTGKTILSARMTEHLLEDRSRLFAFFFCYYGNDLKRDCNSIIKAWIAQIVKKDSDACSIAIAVHREKESGFANRFEIWQIFRRINALARTQYYLVDGFDECDRNDNGLPNHDLLDAKTRFLTQLIEATNGNGNRLLIMSRPDAEIRDQMHAQIQDARTTKFEWVDSRITLEDTSDDLICFTQSVITRKLPNRLVSDLNIGCGVDVRMLSRDFELRQGLAAETAQKADGMFLWIKLLYSRLSRSMSPPRLRKIITDTPSGLDQAYERDILAILDLEIEERVRATAILRWTLFALRPLTIRQLSEALLIQLRDEENSEDEAATNFGHGGQFDSDEGETDDEDDYGVAGKFVPLDEVPNFNDDETFADEFLKTCGSLIELRGGENSKLEDRTVHFVHFSVQEYLAQSMLPSMSEFRLSDRQFSHETLAQVCLQYLLYDDFRQTTNSTLEKFNERKRKYALLDYAGTTWGWHADRCRPLPGSILSLCQELLDPLKQKWLSYSEVVGGRANGSFNTFLTRFRDSYPSPLFYASLWGIVDCMRFLVAERKENVNHAGGLYGSPLNAAIAHGHEDAVSYLLENGANFHVNSGRFGTAVNTAAATGQVRILGMLLGLMPDISMKGGWGGEPPLVAAYRSSRKSAGHIVRSLLSAGASCYATDKSGSTAVHNFASIGAVDVLKIFLDCDTDLDCLDAEGKTPLMAAIELSRYNTTEFLIFNGANVNLRDRDGDSALHYAISTSRPDFISILLEHHADVNAVGRNDRTPLHDACEVNNVTIVKMLLDRGADHTLKDRRGQTALDLAARSLPSDFAEDLLELLRSSVSSDSTESQPSWGEQAESSAVSLLLEYGADAGTRDQDGKTALQRALEYRDEDSEWSTDSEGQSLQQSEESGDAENDDSET